MKSKFLKSFIWALAIITLVQFFLAGNKSGTAQQDIVLTGFNKASIGKEVQIQVINNTPETLTLPSTCPHNPLIIEKYENGQWIVKDDTIKEEFCKNVSDLTLEAGKKGTISFAKWNNDLFGETGKYRVSLKQTLNGTEKVFFHEFEITEPSIFKKGWNNLFYRPILNLLIYLVSVIPGHNLAWAILLLTLIVKLLLLAPNHKALQAQKRMQKVQPELDALKLKHKDNPQLLAAETMLVWKKYKISPMDSCLPTLIQFPILIALFYVIKDGLNVVNPHVFYGPLQTFDVLSIQTDFFGLFDLAKVNPIVLPIIVGGLQFIQMKLTFKKTKGASQSAAANPALAMTSTMQYALPVMIALFTASMPAAVGFYWGASTVFGIVQQMIVNASKD